MATAQGDFHVPEREGDIPDLMRNQDGEVAGAISTPTGADDVNEVDNTECHEVTVQGEHEDIDDGDDAVTSENGSDAGSEEGSEDS